MGELTVRALPQCAGERRVRRPLAASSGTVESARMRSRLTTEIAGQVLCNCLGNPGSCQGVGSRGARDITCGATTVATAKCDVGHGSRRMLPRISLDGAGTGGTAEWRSGPVSADEVKDLRGIVRIWTRLTHRPSDDPSSFATTKRLRVNSFCVAEPTKGKVVSTRVIAGIGLLLIVLTGCGPKAHIPLRPVNLPGLLPPSDSGAVLARSLAPVLYLQLDETFPLVRSIAVVHPQKRIIAYHLLWRDDVNGSWIPLTVPTDQEIVWVAYDSTNAPTEVWTYWHGTILHTMWPRSQVAINVQWGKHGSLPRGIDESDLPPFRTLNFFYASTIFLLPDILLGDITRKGPFGFYHSYRRYRDFSRPMLLAEWLDAIVRTTDPDRVLRAYFGEYSRKPAWPQGI